MPHADWPSHVTIGEALELFERPYLDPGGGRLRLEPGLLFGKWVNALTRFDRGPAYSRHL